ncbi:MAG: spore coat protein CotJB [Bacilli bacterium]|nr:spore coat protein CotJB [Bacilli bacterium]
MNFDTFDEINYFTNINDSNNMNENDITNHELNSKIFGTYLGYIKGNLFKNLYQGYKNYEPRKININNEQDELLLNVNELSFARHEMNLLLDNYPNNNQALKTFNHFREMEEKAIQNYERRFGPIEITSGDMNNIPFAWENDKWPWEM